MGDCVASPSSQTHPAPAKTVSISTNAALAIGILALLVGTLYGGIIVSLVADWVNDPNYSHGFLVPLFSGFLVWRGRAGLSRLPLRPTWWGLPAVAASLGVLVVGRLGAEFFLMRSSLVFLLASLVLYFCGWRWLRALLFPIAFLFLMIPIPAILYAQITLPLQIHASRMASWFLTLFGVPVLREGNIIQLPAITLEVAEACSGIRSLISLIALAVIYGYFLEPSLWRRILLVAAAVPIAIAANALRITGTGLLVQFWSPEAGTGFFHAFSGWLIFVLAMLMLFAFHAALRSTTSRRYHA
jgi:exosortase